ncbi:MAG TPA: hypothetical protein PLZ99_02150 [Parcubacteria group bacterium]|jgi:hypothetical protein|nr:hypothetical protein [Parcubacteria group bacterium]
MNIEPYHVLLFIHFVSLITGFGAVIVIDTFGLLWILKKVKMSFVTQVANVTQRLIWLGYTGLVLTGIPLILMKESISGLSTIKIFAVILVGLNGVYLHFIKKSMGEVSDDTKVSSLTKFRITLATTISQVGWWTAIIIGFLNNKLKTSAPVIENPYNIILPIVTLVLVVGVLGEIVFKKFDK